MAVKFVKFLICNDTMVFLLSLAQLLAPLYIFPCFLALCLLLRITTRCLTCPLELTHSPNSSLGQKFTARVSHLKYVPYWYCMNKHQQGWVYLFYNWAQLSLKCFHLRYEREWLNLTDGCTITIDWYKRKPLQKDTKPILIMLPGMGGES